MTTTLWVVLGYLVGSVPFAFLITRASGRVDIRQLGSGNVGAANVLRVAGSRAALMTALFDIAKGAAVVLTARAAGAAPGVCASVGAAAVGGHIYPIWLRFRGGKGVATTCGVFAVLAPLATLLAAVMFAGVVRATRRVSLGSMAAAVSLGPLAYAVGTPNTAVRAAFFSGCLILFNHRSNLIRLAGGTEARLGDDVPRRGDAP